MTVFTRRQAIVAATACVFTGAGALPAAANSGEWAPTKPVRIVVPFAPGVSPDVVARILAEPLSKALGQPVVIDNRPGAAGIIGAEAAAKSPPDGLTIFLTVNSIMGINPNVYSKLPYDTFRDFVPVTQVVLVPYVLVAGPQNANKGLKELLSNARGQPDVVTYGSLGIGSGPHVVTEMMNNMAGVKMRHVPYKGTPVTDVMGGVVDVAFDPATTAIPMVRSGRLRGLAVTSRQRLAQLPDVPTVAEVLPGYEGDGWQGVYMPAKTPSEAIARYNKEIRAALQLPEVRAKLLDLGLQPVGTTAEEFAAISRREVDKWGKIARQNNIRVE